MTLLALQWDENELRKPLQGYVSNKQRLFRGVVMANAAPNPLNFRCLNSQEAPMFWEWGSHGITAALPQCVTALLAYLAFYIFLSIWAQVKTNQQTK